MNEPARRYLYALLASLCACSIEGTLGAYRTDADAAATTSDASTSADAATDSDTMDACGTVAGAGPCPACLRSACCESLAACEQPPSCNCMFECITAGSPAKTCAQQCTPEPASKEFSQCAMKYCAATCEGAAP